MKIILKQEEVKGFVAVANTMDGEIGKIARALGEHYNPETKTIGLDDIVTFNKEMSAIANIKANMNTGIMIITINPEFVTDFCDVYRGTIAYVCNAIYVIVRNLKILKENRINPFVNKWTAKIAVKNMFKKEN